METVLALRPAWPSWMPAFWPCECTKSVMRLSGAIWLSAHRPESSGEMRPLAATAVASTMVRAAPRSAKAPRCTRWKSVRWPSSALYMHMGETAKRFESVTPRIVSGVKSVGTSGSGPAPASRAATTVPAGGTCSGV